MPLLYEPLPHQIEGRNFLSGRKVALLADEPRVGKTGAAIMAADDILASRILVITTASGRPVWVRGFADWSAFDIPAVAVYGAWKDEYATAGRLIVSWSELAKHADHLISLGFDLIIADESHYAKSVEAARSKALYGVFSGHDRRDGIVDRAERVWCLTGTPIPNAPDDLFPMLRALAPERLGNFTSYPSFLGRYCTYYPKKLNRWKSITVVTGGKNGKELKERLDGFWLRRSQTDVGITRPAYELLPIHISNAQRQRIEAEIEGAEDILAAAETGETKSVEMHLGTLRRVTGTVKAGGVVLALHDEFKSGLDKVVLMCWHRDVMDLLAERLSDYGVVRVSGSTDPHHREEAIRKFQTSDFRVFIGQIIAAGEAIDLSAASELIFVESSFVPKDMAQAALRITNHGQKRQPRVRVATLEGSIDEAVQTVLIRKIASNKEVIR